MTTHKVTLLPIAFLFPALAVLAGGCLQSVETDEHPGTDQAALTAAQCSYFDVNGKNTICHRTSSATHPYTIIRTSEQGCINGHAGHAQDYIAVGDPTCQGGGCLPVTAPCDATLPCCDGLTCQNGTCVDRCAGVTCAPSDACHVAGTCNPATGICSNPNAANGTACNDGNGCTLTDTCVAGACTGSGNPCQNGGTCNPGGSCTCPAGFTGTNCQTPVCVPTTCAAQGATCGTIPDGCGGTLTCGSCGSGFTCQSGTCQPTAPACPCEGMTGWGVPAPPPLCINYSGLVGPGSIYYYLKSNSDGHSGPFVQFAVNGQFGQEPDMCGVVSVANTLDTRPLVSQAQAEACVVSFKNFAGSCPLP